MIQKYEFFRKKLVDDPVKSENTPKEGAKKFNREGSTKKVDESSSSIRFLKNRKDQEKKESPKKEKEIPEESIEEIVEMEIPKNTKGLNKINEGFLSREFVEGWIGRPLNTQKKPEPIREEKVYEPNVEPQPKPQPKKEEPKQKAQEEYKKPPKREEPVKEYKKEREEEEIYEDEVPIDSNSYPLFRDKAENFECKVHVEGATLNNTKVRLLVETQDWNVYFNGRMSPDGKCVIPLKKMSILPEGLKGTISLEVIVDNEVFCPWKETFQVQSSKKVKIEILSGHKESGPKVKVSGI